MKKFPCHLTPNNIGDFKEYYHKKCLSLLRNLITTYLYENSKGGIGLYQLESSKYPEIYRNRKIKQELIDDVCKELHELGWKTKIVYGDSCLFIYSDDKDLPSFDGELI